MKRMTLWTKTEFEAMFPTIQENTYAPDKITFRFWRQKIDRGIDSTANEELLEDGGVWTLSIGGQYFQIEDFRRLEDLLRLCRRHAEMHVGVKSQ